MSIPGIDSRIERIESFDGTLIATACWGEKDQPTVIFSNGICCTDTYWTYLQPLLVEAGYRVIFFDYRGHNRSAAPRNPNEVTLPAHARDLWRVADHYEVDKAVLIGHSMGVQAIFEAYRQHPERVTGLVALAGPYEYPLDKLYMTPIGAVILAGLELTWKYSPSAFRTAWEVTGLDTQMMVVLSKLTFAISRSAPKDLVEEYFTHVAALDPILIIKMFRGMQMHSAKDVLVQCDVPVLQIAGGRDMLTPLPLQRAMASMLPDVRFEVLEKASHTLPVDEPEHVNDSIIKFLGEVYQKQHAQQEAAVAKAAAKAEAAVAKAAAKAEAAAKTEAIPSPRAQAKSAAVAAGESAAVPAAKPGARAAGAKANGATTAAKPRVRRSRAVAAEAKVAAEAPTQN